ncbi:hypothetical protein EUGRSUZ_G02716 [Eucalyptus grandis]|uniref:Uncharacterized protein n=2 Tax=Eucalyptus grandis TaxID=71139 RepID=A0ACC3K788_EUCGR|nr:hypothetical protein EUGRSUZ_G02716 [Eucalyptus grandis]
MDLFLVWLYVNSGSKRKPVIPVVSIEQLVTVDAGHFEAVVLPDVVPLIDTFVSVLTRMALTSVNGMFHSFLMEENALTLGTIDQNA